MSLVPAGLREIPIHPGWILPNCISTEHFRLVEVVDRSLIPQPMANQIRDVTYLFISRQDPVAVIAVPPLWKPREGAVAGAIGDDDGYPVGMPDPDLVTVFANRIPPIFPEVGVKGEMRAFIPRVSTPPRSSTRGGATPSYGALVREVAVILFDDGYPVGPPPQVMG